MTRLPPALLVLLLALPGLAQPALAALPAASAVSLVAFDRTRHVLASDVLFDTSCSPLPGTASFTADETGRTIHFTERDASPTPAPGLPEGYQARGCGDVRYDTDIPPDTEHIHVRFAANRIASHFPLATGTTPGLGGFVQELRAQVGDARVVTTTLFNSTAGPQAMRGFDPPPLDPAGASRLALAWHFEDTSWGNGVLRQVGPNGSAYAADLGNITVEFSGIPVPLPVVTQHQGRSGTLLVDEVSVAATVRPEDLAGTDLRFRLDPSLAFAGVLAPDGQYTEERSTRVNDGPAGFDRSKPLLERSAGFIQVTLPSDFLAEHGAGTYVLTVSTVSNLHVEAGLVPLAFLLLLAPLPVAALAWRRARAFERAAFGSFRRSARFLRLALAAAALYYLTVLASALVGGRLDLMAATPFTTEAALLYVQVLVAIGAFLALFLVARELYAITQPKEPAHGA